MNCTILVSIPTNKKAITLQHKPLAPAPRRVPMRGGRPASAAVPQKSEPLKPQTPPASAGGWTLVSRTTAKKPVRPQAAKAPVQDAFVGTNPYAPLACTIDLCSATPAAQVPISPHLSVNSISLTRTTELLMQVHYIMALIVSACLIVSPKM